MTMLDPPPTSDYSSAAERRGDATVPVAARGVDTSFDAEAGLPIRMNGSPPEFTPEMLAALPSEFECRWTQTSLLAQGPPAGTKLPGTPYRHCRRCHQVFDEWTNRERDGNEGTCQIMHVVPPRTHSHEFTHEGEWQVVRTECCNTRAYWSWDDEHSSFTASYPRNSMFCYWGRHTSSPEDVEYNGLSIKPCTAMCYWKGLEHSVAGPFDWVQPESK